MEGKKELLKSARVGNEDTSKEQASGIMDERKYKAETGPIRKESTVRQENTRRMETVSSHRNQNERAVNLRTSWQELRRSRMYLSENTDGWKELDGKSTRRLEKEEKKMKSELVRRKTLKFGKAGNSKLTRIEEMLITRNTRKLMEVEEVKLNLSLNQVTQIPNGRKIEYGWKIQEGGKTMKKFDSEEAGHWEAMAMNMRIIEENEKWLEAGWLEISSLEEKRSLLYGSVEKKADKTPKAEDEERMEESSENTDKKVHHPAGIFQKEGKLTLQTARIGTTALIDMDDRRVDTNDHRDAENRCKMGNYEEVRETSREEDSDKAEEPRFDRKVYKMLRQEDKGRTPASTDVMFRNFTSTSTLTANKVKDPISRDILNRKMTEMHSPRLASLAGRMTKSEMRCQERSPGGGKIIKIKTGTPRKNQKVNSIRKLFEQDLKTHTGGNIELLLQSTTSTNLNLGANKIGNGQKDSICVGQPGRGYQTGLRQTCGAQFRPEPDWSNQPGIGEMSQSAQLCEDQPGCEEGK